LNVSRKAVLSIEGLGKAYDGRPVLDGVDLRVREGEVFALLGSSGAGKTTTIRIVAGLLGFERGVVRIGDVPVRAGEPYPRDLYGRVGVVFQEMNLFPHLSALENVCLALGCVRGMSKAAAWAMAREELSRFGLADRAEQHPSALSAGERQRVAIARALVLDPALILMDEPTSNLHPRAVGEAAQTLRSLAERGRSVLVVTHNVRFAKAAGDRFGLIDDGRAESSDDPVLLDRMEEDQWT
jgi:ABC-type polar amino acid transport system ATPase subunit